FGTTVSGRPAQLAGVEKMVGLFINTVAVKVDVKAKTRVTDWLQQLHQAQVARDEFGYLPLTDINRAAGLTGDSALFDSILVFENYPVDDALAQKSADSGLNITNVEGFEGSNFGLSINATMSRVLTVKLESQLSRFVAGLPTQLLGHLKQILLGMTANANALVEQLPMLTETEQYELLHTFNDTQVDYAKDQCIHQLFERQVECTPDNTALMCEGEQLSYCELNQKANQLAHHLVAKGVKPDILVGLCVSRSMDMIVGVLAILKAGGAYVPLDPAYPQARLDHMVKDSGIELLVSQNSLNVAIDVSTVYLDDQLTTDNTNPITALTPSALSPQNLAYVIYTSGSTGLPKGVMVEHGGAVNLAQYQQNKFAVTAQSRVLQFASLSFDAATSEWLMALLKGATLCVSSDTQKQSVDALQTQLLEQKITHATIPPALLEHIDINQPYALQSLIVAGEACDVSLAKRWAAKYRLFNAYGPTETTVCASVAELNGASQMNIGRAMDNSQLLVLGKQNQLLPKGAVGELHIGGVG
ncbi:MAG: AMP-binding protein, partial [Algicola sp.]|nr:AMP-binding protein [Algicola sp.]